MNKGQGKWKAILFAVASAAVLVVALWGPERLAGYRDRGVLNQVTAEQVDGGEEGYRYTLGSNERLYVLSMCMNSRDQQGAYALVVNRQGPSEREITEEAVYGECMNQLRELADRGILPATVREVTKESYQAVLYSAIDVLEPRNSLSVWKISLSTDIKNADKSGRMLDAYMDAETGRIYEFYVRTGSTWEQIDPDRMVEAWSTYQELSGKSEFDSDNPLLENTPYYKKYRFSGIGEENTVVTVGFYEGINELFLKISK
ncbi:MAG: hypothetical protein IJ794_11850 [Lachnospiraceae bacterium]|nr:hypothetical protein [Lachnospiraceae bacterium]